MNINNKKIKTTIQYLLKKRKEKQISIKNIKLIITLFPNHFKSWKLLCDAQSMKMSLETLLFYRKIVNCINPSDADSWFHRGLVSLSSCDHAKSMQFAKKCISIDPCHVRAQVLFGELKQAKGESIVSQMAFRRAACVAQMNAERCALNDALMREAPIDQRIRRLYRLRSKLVSLAKLPKISPSREWRGFDGAAKSVLIWGEQGVGDQVFFARDIQRICRHMARVGIVIPYRLEKLFSTSFPDLEILTAPPDRDILDSFESEILMGNIGDVLPFEEQDVYVNPGQELKARFRRSYARFGSRIAGLSWNSTASLRMDQSKTLPEEILQRLVLAGQNAGLTWISIQHGVSDSMKKEMHKKYGTSTMPSTR